jgi:hypothetical protein
VALENEVQVYWFDAIDDVYNNPGTVYLFGKVSHFPGICHNALDNEPTAVYIDEITHILKHILQRAQIAVDDGKRFVSCTVIVNGIERCMFVAPRKFWLDGMMR